KIWTREETATKNRETTYCVDPSSPTNHLCRWQPRSHLLFHGTVLEPILLFGAPSPLEKSPARAKCFGAVRENLCFRNAQGRWCYLPGKVDCLSEDRSFAVKMQSGKCRTYACRL